MNNNNGNSNRGFRGGFRGGNVRSNINRGGQRQNGFKSVQNKKWINPRLTRGGGPVGNQANRGRNVVSYADLDGGDTSQRNTFRPTRPQISTSNFSNKYNIGNRDVSDFYRVFVPHGAKYKKEWFVTTLKENIEDFRLFKFTVEGRNCIFFVEGQKIADSISSLDKRIKAEDGFVLTFKVTSHGQPDIKMTDDLREKIKEVMASCYNSELQSMDLSRFRDHPLWDSLDVFVSPSRHLVMNIMVKIIKENTPNLLLLSLKDNFLTTLGPLKGLTDACPQLKLLDLSINRIKQAYELENLEKLDLQELTLTGNPLCGSFKDTADYISAVRDRLKNVSKLDGELLPALIGFDIEPDTAVNIPQTLPGVIPADVADFVKGFIQKYFEIFDSMDRQPLVAAYHDQAVFSYSISRFDHNSPNFTDKLIKDSRNLKRVKHDEHASKTLKCGRAEVINHLCSLPRTKHELDSFVVDVPMHNHLFAQVIINGVLRELGRTPSATRAFQRTFIIVPFGQGFVVLNDALLFTNATVNQVKKYKPLSAAEQNQDFPMPGSSSMPQPNQPLANINDEMINLLCQRTGMNHQFSRQCLQESDMNFEQALAMFTHLHSQGAIPSEAFS